MHWLVGGWVAGVGIRFNPSTLWVCRASACSACCVGWHRALGLVCIHSKHPQVVAQTDTPWHRLTCGIERLSNVGRRSILPPFNQPGIQVDHHVLRPTPHQRPGHLAYHQAAGGAGEGISQLQNWQGAEIPRPGHPHSLLLLPPGGLQVWGGAAHCPNCQTSPTGLAMRGPTQGWPHLGHDVCPAQLLGCSHLQPRQQLLLPPVVQRGKQRGQGVGRGGLPAARRQRRHQRAGVQAGGQP